MCVWKPGASRQLAWLYLIGWEKLPWEGFYRGRWGGGDGIPVSQGTPALGTQTLLQGKAPTTPLGMLRTPPSPSFQGWSYFSYRRKVSICILFPLLQAEEA